MAAAGDSACSNGAALGCVIALGVARREAIMPYRRGSAPPSSAAFKNRGGAKSPTIPNGHYDLVTTTGAPISPRRVRASALFGRAARGQITGRIQRSLYGLTAGGALTVLDLCKAFHTDEFCELGKPGTPRLSGVHAVPVDDWKNTQWLIRTVAPPKPSRVPSRTSRARPKRSLAPSLGATSDRRGQGPAGQGRGPTRGGRKRGRSRKGPRRSESRRSTPTVPPVEHDPRRQPGPPRRRSGCRRLGHASWAVEANARKTRHIAPEPIYKPPQWISRLVRYRGRASGYLTWAMP